MVKGTDFTLMTIWHDFGLKIIQYDNVNRFIITPN